MGAVIFIVGMMAGAFFGVLICAAMFATDIDETISEIARKHKKDGPDIE